MQLLEGIRCVTTSNAVAGPPPLDDGGVGVGDVLGMANIMSCRSL